MKVFAPISAAIVLAAALAAPAHAAAVHDSTLFTNVLARNDDGSTGAVSLGFANNINFYGLNAASVYVNNNGNVTFGGELGTFTPFPILTTGISMLAPFFADVDTRNAASDVVRYGAATLGGKSVFGVNWINVGYYNTQANKLNSFQLIITDRSDIAAGDFDFEFNYDNIDWETGAASGGSNGLGGFSARAGWTNGTDAAYEFNGSAVNGALLDGGANALIAGSLNSSIAGQYIFSVRNGTVQPPTSVPEPASLALVALALLGAGVATRKARRA